MQVYYTDSLTKVLMKLTRIWIYVPKGSTAIDNVTRTKTIYIQSGCILYRIYHRTLYHCYRKLCSGFDKCRYSPILFERNMKSWNDVVQFRCQKQAVAYDMCRLDLLAPLSCTGRHNLYISAIWRCVCTLCLSPGFQAIRFHKSMCCAGIIYKR